MRGRRGNRLLVSPQAKPPLPQVIPIWYKKPRSFPASHWPLVHKESLETGSDISEGICNSTGADQSNSMMGGQELLICLRVPPTVQEGSQKVSQGSQHSSTAVLICGRLIFRPTVILSSMGDQPRIYETLSQNQILPTSLKIFKSHHVQLSGVQVNDRRGFLPNTL